MLNRKKVDTHLGFLTVCDWWERDHVALCINEAGVERFSLQKLQVPVKNKIPDRLAD